MTEEERSKLNMLAMLWKQNPENVSLESLVSAIAGLMVIIQGQDARIMHLADEITRLKKRTSGDVYIRR